MKKVRLGVVGIGGIGALHLGILKEGQIRGAELAAVCDRDPGFLERHKELPGFLDHREMFASGKIDAVLIATPHYAHTPVAIDAFRAGLHVLCEKPLAVDKADGEKMIKAWDGKLVFSMMLQLRIAPAMRKAKELVDAGELGRITRVNWIVTNWFRTDAYYASGGWRATWKGEGGGVLINQCPHNLDALQWICGMPLRVQAHCGFGKWHKIEVEDEVTAYMEFPNGATGVFITSTGEAPGTDRFEICGEFGQILIEKGKLLLRRNRQSALKFLRESKESFAMPECWDIEVPVSAKNDAHAGIHQNFIDAILKGTPLIAPGPEGLQQVQLTNAMILAGATGKTVSLPLDAAAYRRFLNRRIAQSSAKSRR